MSIEERLAQLEATTQAKDTQIAELEAQLVEAQSQTQEVVVYQNPPKLKARRKPRSTVWIKGYGRIFKSKLESFLQAHPELNREFFADHSNWKDMNDPSNRGLF